MAVQLNITYETLLQLVEQLPVEQQQQLVRHLLKRFNFQNQAERKELTDAAQSDADAGSTFHIQEDWYGDDRC